MTRFEKGLLLAVSFLAPLSSLRIGGVNLTYFDVAIVGLFGTQLLRTGKLPAIGRAYWGAAALLVSMGAASGLLALQPDLVFQEVLQWAFILFCVVPAVFTVARDSSSTRVVVLGVGLAAALLVGVAQLEALTESAVYRAGRYQGFHENAQQLAFSVASVVAYILVAPVALQGRSRWMSLLLTGIAGIVLLMLGALVLATASRSGMVAATLSTVTAIVLAQRARSRLDALAWLRKGTKISIHLGALVAGLLLLLSLVAPERLAVVERRITLSLDPSSSIMESRTRVYHEALGLEDPQILIHGIGLSNYPLISIYEQRPHNIILMYLWEGGLVFLAAFLLIVWLFVKTALLDARGWERLEPRHRFVAAAAAAGFVAFLAIAMFNTQSISRIYWFNYAYALGALSSLRRL